MQNLSVKFWAEEDRPREKLLLKGRNAVTNAELIAILLGSGNREQSAVQLAQTLLNDAENSLDQLSKHSVSQLMKHKGIGEAKAVTIYAAMELARRKTVLEKNKRYKIRSSKDAYNYIRPYLVDLNHEEFYIIFLNRANDILSAEQLSKGGRSGTIADGKIIFQRALEEKASALILAHNHPSGNLRASEADIRLTKSLMEFGKHIDLQILDHLIITDENYLSFADEAII